MDNKVFKPFKMGDIFEKLKAPYIGNKKNKKEDVSKIKSKEFCIPVVYAKRGNNGIMYWARRNTFTTYKNVISIIYNGAVAAGLVYAHEEETGILAESYFIRIKNKNIPFNANLYLKTIIQKSIYEKYSRENLATWDNRVENEIIMLPVIAEKNSGDKYDVDDIDFEYMEKSILRIDKEKRGKIEEFIKDNNLDDVELTTEELREFSKKTLMSVFKIGDIFSKVDTKKMNYKVNDLPISKTGNYIIPALTAGIENQGLSCYVPGDEATILKNVISVSANGANTGTMFYQPYEFTVLQDSYAIEFKYNEFPVNENVYLYFVSVMNKVVKGNYDWSNKAGWEKIKSLDIELPVKDHNNRIDSLDFIYMNNYINVLKKKIMKRVIISH